MSAPPLSLCVPRWLSRVFTLWSDYMYLVFVEEDSENIAAVRLWSVSPSLLPRQRGREIGTRVSGATVPRALDMAWG